MRFFSSQSCSTVFGVYCRLIEGFESLPDGEGVFRESQTIKDLPLASDAQIYVDLQKTGLRGPDPAQALRDWEGFCRP